MNFPFPIHSSHHFPSRSDDNVSDSLWSVRLFKYTQNIKWAPLFLRRSFLMKATTSWWEDDVMRMPHCLQICGHRFTYCCAISGIIHPHHDWSQATVRAIGSFIVQIICCGGKRRIGPETGLDWTANQRWKNEAPAEFKGRHSCNNDSLCSEEDNAQYFAT